MNLKNSPELSQFLSTYILDADPEGDEQATQSFVDAAPPQRRQQVLSQAKLLCNASELPLEELGTISNRWFGDAEEARSWLQKIIRTLEGDAPIEGASVVVKDSNGTPLSEGDSVTVIKDLKVKGGSSDLKRGTLIKKIHLIDDPDLIECRVDGSTLVLKTIFLKKA